MAKGIKKGINKQKELFDCDPLCFLRCVFAISVLEMYFHIKSSENDDIDYDAFIKS